MLVSPIKSTTFKSMTEAGCSGPASQCVVAESKQAETPSNFVASADVKNKKRTNPLSVTGWTAVGGFVVAAVSGIMHNPKIHKISALVGTIAAAAHVGLVYGHRHNHRHNHKQGTDIKA